MFANSLINPSSNTEDAYSKESFASSDETVSGDEVASQIESILGEIKGVGKVKVLITYKNSGTNVYAKDVSRTTDAEEQKSQDGKTVIKKTEDLTSSLVFTGQKQPIIEEKNSAEVKGVLVVAEGANDPTVCGPNSSCRSRSYRVWNPIRLPFVRTSKGKSCDRNIPLYRTKFYVFLGRTSHNICQILIRRV